MLNALAICLIASAALGPQTPVQAAPTEAYLLFDGIDDEVAVPHAADFAFTSAVTVEAWIMPRSISKDANQNRVVSKSSALELTISTGDTGCGFGTSGHVQWRATIGGVDRRICGGSLTVGQWTHIAGTYDGLAVRLYINGALVASASRSGTLSPGTTVLKIGTHPTSARNFDGGIDEVRIWKRALAQSEIEANLHNELTATEPGLVAYYDFGRGTGQVAIDQTGRDHDGMLGFSSGTDAKDPAWAFDPNLIWPGASWATATPQAVDLDPALITAARNYALSAGGAGVITRGGKLVSDWGNVHTRFDVKSTTKSMAGAAMLGLALDDRAVALSDLGLSYLASFGVPPTSNTATGWLGSITLKHLATHTAGFPKSAAFGALLFAPGTAWTYSDGGTNWLADVLTVRYGVDLQTILFPRVFNQIGIPSADITWRDNLNRTDTLNAIKRREFNAGISASADAMARYGYLWLRNGNWLGQAVIAAPFTERAQRVQAEVQTLPVTGDLNNEFAGGPRHYGLLWWNNFDGALANVPRDAYWAWGLGDSLIVVIPSLDIVASRAGNSWPGTRTPSYYAVIEPFVDPIARAAGSGQTAPPFPGGPYLRFDGNDDEVSVAHAPDLAFTQALTFEAWIRPVSISTTLDQDRVISKSSLLELTISTGDTGCGFGTHGDVQWRATINGIGGRVCGGSLPLDAWSHIAGTYNGSTFALYLNGALLASVGRTGNLSANTSIIKIGNHSTSVKPFDGGIDEVRIWNRALSQAEIQANISRQLTGTEPGLIAYYDMNEGSGQILTDRTGRGHNGTLGFSSGTDAKDPTWSQ